MSPENWSHIFAAAAFWPYQFLKLSLFVGRNASHSLMYQKQ
jgi:hypothetical protein